MLTFFLVAELHRRPLYPTNVRQHVIWRILLLRIPHASCFHLRLFPHTRDKGCPS